MKPFELIPHTADLGIRVHGRTRKALFTNAAKALFAILLERGARGRGNAKTRIRVEAEAADLLLVRWLQELLYRHSTEHVVYGKFRVNALDERHIDASAWGEPFDPARHALTREIKAVTYHGLELVHDKHGYHATIIFDL